MICGICGKEYKVITIGHIKTHNMSKSKFLSTFPESRLSWNSGLTKENDSRIKGGCKKGHNLGHPGYFSRERLGIRFDEINKERKLNISKNNDREGCRKGQRLGVEARKRNGNLKWKLEAPGRKSPKYKGRIPWNFGLTKYTNESIREMANAKRKYPEGIDFELFGWTENLKQTIRKRDNYICQDCGEDGWLVHHKDGIKFNNYEDNLITLCRKCHSDKHIKNNVQTGKFEKILV